MDTRRLKYFIAVAERLSVTAAARHLGMAQPPLSAQIRTLESEMGCSLFDRKNRRLTLTPAGIQLLAAATDVLAQMDRAFRQIQDQAAGRLGEICLEYTDAAFTETVTRRLRKFQRKHRGLRLAVRPRSGGNLENFTADGLIADFAISDLPPQGVSLQSSRIQIAVPPKHRLADRAELQVSDLIGETFLLSPKEDQTAAERHFRALADQTGLSFDTRIGPSRLQDRFWQVSLGLGLAICTAGDRGALDAVRISLANAPEVVTALVPNPDSRAAALPLLLEAFCA